MRQAGFRFYEDLNNFLPAEHRKRTIRYAFEGHPGIKDLVEAMGIPRTEVDILVVNGRSVGFEYQLQDNDRVALYPVFESLRITPIDRPLAVWRSGSLAAGPGLDCLQGTRAPDTPVGVERSVSAALPNVSRPATTSCVKPRHR